MMLTAERLRELLHYDRITGLFTYRVTRGNRVAGSVAGSLCDGYIHIKVDNVLHKAHRLAWLYMTGEWPVEEIDHEDRCRSNNVWYNLRPATKSQNQANRGRNVNNKSGFKGVHFHRLTGKWAAALTCGGARMHLGLFNTPEEAHEVYSGKIKESFPQFACAA